MYSQYRRISIVFLILIISVALQPPVVAMQAPDPAFVKGRSWYFNTAGDDAGKGNKAHPYKNLDRLNTLPLKPGDTVFLQAAQIFKGPLQLPKGLAGTKERPIVITSYGWGKAVIDGGDQWALGLYQARYITLRNLQLTGSGRKNGNKENGLAINNCRHITLDSLIVSGFQKAGIYVYQSSYIRITRVHAQENGYAGISLEGAYGKRDCDHVLVKDCLADNNPGDPSNLVNHSGNGIVAGYCRAITIDRCSATNNGWDMPRVGNGPVGIWAYESDSLLIQHCLSYRNHTAKGADDGGGFDLDGGVTHSVIQYCLSYENEGSGFGIFQYAGAAGWHDNSIHDCVSNNDGLVSAARAGVFIWNNSGDAQQFRNCSFYNNIVYNTKGAALHLAKEGERSGFRFYNNAFISTDSLIKGKKNPSDIFENNHWTGLLPDSTFH